MPCGQPDSGAAPARYVLGVDVGSTVVKCHVYDRAAAVRGSSYRKVNAGGCGARSRSGAGPSGERAGGSTCLGSRAGPSVLALPRAVPTCERPRGCGDCPSGLGVRWSWPSSAVPERGIP